MLVSIDLLNQLLDAVVAQGGGVRTQKNLRILSEEIGLGSEYLYKKIHLKIRQTRQSEKPELLLHDSTLDMIARYLKFLDFEDWKSAQKTPLPHILAECAGTYYSYLRRATEEGAILRSPVKMWVENRELKFKQQGPSQLFSAAVHMHSGCLYVYMVGDRGKRFLHVYRIGDRLTPKLLKGIFSGMSASNEPIGGRVVLIREEQDYEKLTCREFNVEAWSASKNDHERLLAAHFRTASDNNLQTGRSTTFDLSDLTH